MTAPVFSESDPVSYTPLPEDIGIVLPIGTGSGPFFGSINSKYVDGGVTKYTLSVLNVTLSDIESASTPTPGKVSPVPYFTAMVDSISTKASAASMVSELARVNRANAKQVSGVTLTSSSTQVLESEATQTIDPGKGVTVALALFIRNSDLLASRTATIKLQRKIGAGAYADVASFPRTYTMSGPINLVNPPSATVLAVLTIPNDSANAGAMRFQVLATSSGGNVSLVEGSLLVSEQVTIF